MTVGHPLRAHGVPDDTRQALEAVRVIVAAMKVPKLHLSVPGIAEMTGLDESAVHELLASDIYKQMVIGTCKQRCAGIFAKGITRLEGIVDDPETSPYMVMEAIDTTNKLYKTLNQDTGGHHYKQSRADEEEFIKQLSMMNQINDSTSSPEPAKVVTP